MILADHTCSLVIHQHFQVSRALQSQEPVAGTLQENKGMERGSVTPVRLTSGVRTDLSAHESPQSWPIPSFDAPAVVLSLPFPDP